MFSLALARSRRAKPSSGGSPSPEGREELNDTLADLDTLSGFNRARATTANREHS
ncbi:MAG: hypothetical protein ACK4LQ_09740 [Pararhodobacter sp.]